MLFVTSIEGYYLCKGIYWGIKTALNIQFGDAGLQLMPEIRAIYEEEKLEAILKALETEAGLDEVRRL